MNYVIKKNNSQRPQNFATFPVSACDMPPFMPTYHLASWSFDPATLQSSFPVEIVDWWSDVSSALAGFPIQQWVLLSLHLTPPIEVDEDPGRWVWIFKKVPCHWANEPFLFGGRVVIGSKNVMVAPFWFAETISQLNNSLFLAEMGLCEGMPWQPGSLRVQPTGPLSQKNMSCMLVI